MTNGMEDLQNINKHVDALQEQIKREALDKLKPALTKAVKYFYENVEDVASIRWTQYTPYFNDGEPCEFGVYDLMLRFEDDEKNEYHESHDGYCGIYSYKGSNSGLTKKNADIFHALEKCLMQNPVLLELAFGDHAEITIDKEGNVEVEEYEHD